MNIEKSKFQKALETVKPGLASTEIIEQATHFCFLNGNMVTYNDEISISVPLKELDIEGAVNAKELYQFVSKAPSDEISIDIEENQVILKSGKSKAGVNLQTEVVLPISEVGEIKKWIKLPENFLDAVEFAMEACSRDTSRPILQCVHVTKKHVEASDNYRVCRYFIEGEFKTGDFLIRNDYCRNVIHFKPLEMSEGDQGWIHFKNSEGAVMSCRTLEEKFPVVDQFFKIDGGVAVNFPDNILEILDRANAFGKDFVTVNLTDNKLTIQAKSENGWFEEKSRVKSPENNNVSFMVSPNLLKGVFKVTRESLVNNNVIGFFNDKFQFISMLMHLKQ